MWACLPMKISTVCTSVVLCMCAGLSVYVWLFILLCVNKHQSLPPTLLLLSILRAGVDRMEIITRCSPNLPALAASTSISSSPFLLFLSSKPSFCSSFSNQSYPKEQHRTKVQSPNRLYALVIFSCGSSFPGSLIAAQFDTHLLAVLLFNSI